MNNSIEYMGASLESIAKAKAFALGIKQIIGSEPQINIYPEYTEVTFSPEQRQLLISYLDRQVGSFFQRKEPGDLRISFGEFLIPWSIRYMIPAMLGLFLLGYSIRGFAKTSKKR